jgi:hypothetical protein
MLLLVITFTLKIIRTRPNPFSLRRIITYLFLITFGSFFVFYWLLGFYAQRLTFGLVPIILIAGMIELNYYQHKNRLHRLVVFNGVFLASAGWIAFHLIKHGPYF